MDTYPIVKCKQGDVRKQQMQGFLGDRILCITRGKNRAGFKHNGLSIVLYPDDGKQKRAATQTKISIISLLK